MEKENASTVVTVNIILAAALTFISYFYNLFNLGDIEKLRDFLVTGQPFMVDYVAQSPLLRYIPLLPVFLAWFFIGAIMYFFYYALANAYGAIYNQLLIQGYVKAEIKEDFTQELKAIERFGMHLVVITSFVLFILLYTFVLLPLSEKLVTFTSTFISSLNLEALATIAIPILALYLYWTILVLLIQVTWHYVKMLEDYETFKAEHEAI